MARRIAAYGSHSAEAATHPPPSPVSKRNPGTEATRRVVTRLIHQTTLHVQPDMSDYHFVTSWHLPSTRIEEVAAILDDPPSLVRWWPSVYLAIEELPSPPGSPRSFDLFTKGWLPYTLRWRFRVGERRLPVAIELHAEGDFVGTGRWRLEQAGPDAVVTYDWRIRAEKPLLRRLTFLLRPLFAWNHHWAMARGCESLELEVRRRRGEEGVPDPVGPTFRWFRRQVPAHGQAAPGRAVARGSCCERGPGAVESAYTNVSGRTSKCLPSSTASATMAYNTLVASIGGSRRTVSSGAPPSPCRSMR